MTPRYNKRSGTCNIVGVMEYDEGFFEAESMSLGGVRSVILKEILGQLHLNENVSKMVDTHENHMADKKALVRSFSDDWKIQDPDSTLSQSLAAKVEQDRQIDRARREWTLLFTDAARIAE